MRYLIPAIILVAAIIAGLIYMPEKWGEEPVEVSQSGTRAQGDFVDLPPPAEPDYSTVVTDEALARELAQDAEKYLSELSEANAGNQPEDGSFPRLLTADSQLTWAGENGSVAELLQKYGINVTAGMLYYAHPVTTADIQGVWGIVQGELVSRFAEGIAVRRSDDIKTYKLLIPQHADERNADGSSSFLGKVIWQKTQQAKIVNTQQGWARSSADTVIPEQDLVIVSFARQELVAIYQYFATRGH